MKILSLKGKNLASLEGEFAIDFRAEPLVSSGIFAITGNTGAGKSTLLDAICLALFDDAPRTHKAGENISVADVQDKTINQKDSRSILRRGATDGYAQLEFVALDGKSYRSSWSVKRARGKAEGALQSVEMRLENLSDEREEQGRKTEILARIVELIGLNFEQFTRAVLLAQGDFATFLKAKQGEKAELLEKLTGTQVYSLISTRIYEKTQEAKQDLQTLAERMKDIKLLSEEELVLLEADKKEQAEELTKIKLQINSLHKQLEWIGQEKQLRQDATLAENEFVALKMKLEESASRFQYIEKVEAAQEIRGVYLDLKNKEKQLQDSKEHLENQQLKLAQLSENLALIKKEVSGIQAEIDQHESEYQRVSPQIEKAKALDVELKSAHLRNAELQTELAKQKKTLEGLLSQHNIFEKDKKSASEKVVSLTQWFQEKEYIGRVIPSIDRVVSQLKDYGIAKNQISTIQKNVLNNEALLKTRLEALALSESELERLQNELSSEVVLLREKLEEGKPCPVCGSVHHPSKDEVQSASRLQEEQLEKEKNKLIATIESKKKEIELGKEEITRLKATLVSYQERVESILEDVGPSLSFISDWKERLEANSLTEQLLKTQKIWNDNNELLQKSKEQETTLLMQITNSTQHIETVQTTVVEQTEKFTQATHAFSELQEQRNQLLGGKSATEVQEYFEKKRKQLAVQLTEIQSKNEMATKEHALLSGELEQLRKNMLTLDAAINDLRKLISGWISSNEYRVDSLLLAEIAQRSSDWIRSEKASLQQLKDAEISISAKLRERRDRLTAHLQSPLAKDIPEEEELKNHLVEQEAVNESVIRRINEIDFVQQEQIENQKRIQSFEKELNAKEEFFNNWAKLNELLGSANGSKFKEIAQGYTLDVLLLYANKQLYELTRRYRLQRIPDTLALQVVDEDMMGEVRSVHSLSGGESFLISLSLALGLSSLSSNRMKIESLFIDEGFGSLDIDTLSVATDALENLQTQGRKIGVISHVAEMTERIKTQIRVIKSANGRSRVEVVG
jgi:DNA repair protein SbcC/Rad50